jgi:hypothetical protein
MPLCYSTHLPAITGVYYASHESLQNLKMLEWEITRLRNLRKVTTSNALKEDVDAIVAEIDLVLRLDLEKDVKEKLGEARVTLGGLVSGLKKPRCRKGRKGC